MKTIAIINQKGGVGKTTTSINLSCGLAIKGKKVLLIDLDPQAHSTIGLGIESEKCKYAIQDSLINKKNIREIILKTNVKNLDLVPSNIRLDKAEQLLIPEPFKETRLKKSIANLDYNFIIIDCRPTLGTLTANALVACNFIIVPTEVTRFSLEGFADLMDTIHQMKSNDELENRDIKNYVRILLTKFDSRKKVSIDWFMTQLEPYKEIIFETKIRNIEALNQAQIVGESIFSYNPNSPSAEDYSNLTKELINL